MTKGIRNLFSKRGEDALQTILGSAEGAVPQEEDLSTWVSEGVVLIPVDDIAPNPFQSRKRFDEGKIWTLSESLKGRGMLHPIVLRKAAGPAPGCKYEVIAGERRLRAAQMAGLTEVPAMIREVDDTEMKLLTLIENMQREELNVVEKTLSIGSLQREIGDTLATAEALGLSRRSVERYTRIESVMTSSQMLLSLFQRNADLIDFRDAEAIAEIGRRLGQEELRDFVEAVNEEGIKRALKRFRQPLGGKPGPDAQHPPVQTALRETGRHISLVMRYEKGAELGTGERDRLRTMYDDFVARIDRPK